MCLKLNENHTIAGWGIGWRACGSCRCCLSRLDLSKSLPIEDRAVCWGLFCPFDGEAFTALAVAAALLTNKRNKRTSLRLSWIIWMTEDYFTAVKNDQFLVWKSCEISQVSQGHHHRFSRSCLFLIFCLLFFHSTSNKSYWSDGAIPPFQ